MKRITYDWDPVNGTSICTIRDHEKVFYGMAYCREEDRDMMSEKTGMTIAMMRAQIEQLIDTRDNELKPSLKALKVYLNTINQSQRHSPDSYEAKMLQRQIKQYEEKINLIQDMIRTTKGSLKIYMNDKAEFYNKVRANRDKDKNN